MIKIILDTIVLMIMIRQWKKWIIANQEYIEENATNNISSENVKNSENDNASNSNNHNGFKVMVLTVTIRVLIIECMLIGITEVVIKIIIIIIVIIITYKGNSTEKKETLTSARNRLGKNALKYFYWRLQALQGKKLKKMTESKETKAVGYITPTMDHYDKN